jgi:peptidoglycan L-alanyl-D-glutamate endopeptidase CwlK
MNRILFIILFVFPIALLTCSSTQKKDVSAESPAARANADSVDTAQGATLPAGLKCLLKAYPEFLESGDTNSIYWKDGSKMVYDDGKTETDFETMLNHASLKDQMSICYAKDMGEFTSLPVNDDPGRARYEPFFYKMYGSSPEEVRKKLVPVIWLPQHIRQKIMVTTVNGIDEKIRAISDELDKLPPEFTKYLENPGGTFNWRVIAGTNRQSTHSFGMTIDINVKSSDYWRNYKPDKDGRYIYKNRIPSRIVEIFEKHGFIWGGKWYHYDTMHFEYRPELLVDQCVCSKSK